MKEKFSQKLLVEGNDDQHVLWALCEKFAIHQNFDVINGDGIDNLFAQIPVRFKQSGIETIGIIIDADTDLAGRWQTLTQIFCSLGIYLPDTIPSAGYISSADTMLRIGIWIMPNNKLDGMLEDFIAFLVPPTDTLMPIIAEHIDAIEHKQLNKYKLIHRSKAIIHSWLSIQEVPGTPLGLSITKKYLAADDSTCASFIDWIKTLYSRQE